MRGRTTSAVWVKGIASMLAGEGRRYRAEDDDDFGASVVQLMFELSRRVEWVHDDLDRTRPDDPQHRDWKSRDVRQHHGNTFALIYAELALKIGGEAAR